MTPPNDLAKRYARAFFQAVCRGKTHEAFQDLQNFVSVFVDHRDLRKVLLHPAIKVERKTKLLEKVFAAHTNKKVLALLQLLINKKRLKHLPAIAEEVWRLHRHQQGIQGVHVTSALPLLPPERKRLHDVLSRTYGTIEIRERVDPAIKGGLVIWLENSVIDASVRARLRKLQEMMLRIDKTWLLQQTAAATPDRPESPTPGATA